MKLMVQIIFAGSLLLLGDALSLQMPVGGEAASGNPSAPAVPTPTIIRGVRGASPSSAVSTPVTSPESVEEKFGEQNFRVII